MRASQIAVIGASLALALACSERHGTCETTADCLEVEICRDGRCRSICNVDRDCENTERCENGACMPVQRSSDAGATDVQRGDSGPATDAAATDTRATDALFTDALPPDTLLTDALLPDAPSPDAVEVDADALDGGPPDTGRTDRAAPDAAQPDARQPDAAAQDATPQDGATTDAAAIDAARADTAQVDAGRPDTDQLDSTPPDNAQPDTSPLDITPPDGCVPDCFERCGGQSDGCAGSCDDACPPDECTLGTDNCDPCNGVCTDTWAGFSCACRPGYSGDGVSCSYQDDGSVTVTGTVDLSSDPLATGRSCADGMSFSVEGLTQFQADLSEPPPTCCLGTGDSVLLINLQGSSGASDNVGHYERRTIGAVVDSTVYFNEQKQRFYGSGSADDNDLGLGAGQQRVAVVRVPRYTDVVVEAGGVISSGGWDGDRGGVLALEVIGAVQIAGWVDMSGRGYSGGNPYCPLSTGVRGRQGESFIGQGVNARGLSEAQAAAAPNFGGGGGGCFVPDGHCEWSPPHGENRARSYSRPGGGGGHAAVGGTSLACSNISGTACSVEGGEICGDTCQYESSGGLVYGVSDLRQELLLGSGGGGGSARSGAEECLATPGGSGGGTVFIWASTIEVTGAIEADGGGNDPGYWAGGGGAGGSVLLSATGLALGAGLVTALGGSAPNSGGAGRITLDPGGGTVSGSTDPPAYVVP